MENKELEHLKAYFEKHPQIAEGLEEQKTSSNKLKEAEVLQLLVKLRDLGIECYNEDGSPMIKTMKAGEITLKDMDLLRRQEEWDKQYGPQSDQLHKYQTPARPSKEEDERNDNIIKQLQMPLKKQDETDNQTS